MAMVKCPECGKEISDSSSKCVHCGYRKRLSKKVKVFVTIACMLQLIAVILLLACSYIYTLEEYYYQYYESEFGSEFDRSYYLHYFDSYSNILLKHSSSTEADVPVAVEITSYIVILLGTFGVVAYLNTLLREIHLRHYWLIPLLTAGSLLIHSIEVSVLKLSMIGTRGYYEIRPTFLWCIIVAMEILAAVLGKKSTEDPVRGNKEKSQSVTDCANDGFVDAHGVFHSIESEITMQNNRQ